MARRSSAALAGLIGMLIAVPALAQFGGIFSEGPPRPPGSVPGGRQQSPTPSPQPNYGSQPNYGPPQGGGPYGAIQGQPLPPPSAGIEPPSRTPPSQRQQRAVPPPSETPPTPPTEQATAEPVTPPVVNNGALFTGLDKITGRIINFDVAIGETVQFGALQLTPRSCYTRPTTEAARTDAFVEVDEVTLQGEVRRLFTGWMFAASPGLHAVEHPVYDIWLTDCKDPAVTAEKTPAFDPAATTPARAQARQPAPPQQTQQRRTNPPQQGTPIR